GLAKAYDEEGNLLDRYGNETTDITEVEGYRLPTEAEWEYAARGGNKSNGYKYAGSNDPDEVAWYWDNSGGHTHEVGTKKPNELGIYDMSGNVWEWCQDWYDSDYYEESPKTNPYNHEMGSYRVSRGGSWYFYASFVRVADRYRSNPDVTNVSFGFRVCRTAF
ncbi:MAG: formylglycine-generating enzyme family protein, partial [Petrotogales bacterium]